MKKLFVLIFVSLILLTSCAVEPNAPEVTTEPSTAESGTTELVATTEQTENTTEEETTKEEPAMPLTLRIGSYNIKHGAEAGLDLTKIGEVIKSRELDIVGLQEIDYKTTRSNGVDQPAKLAEAADMPYYVFVPAIDYQGGKYGTLILSKYPIVSSEVVPLVSWDKEARALGHAVIDVNGRRLDFFNTHLAHDDASLRTLQFAEVAEKTSLCKDFILTGDFNTAKFSEFSVFDADILNRAERNYPTFESGSAIDNIVYTDSFSETESGTVTKSHSDHYMLWAEFEWK